MSKKEIGLEYSGGSLGMAISVGIGIALGKRYALTKKTEALKEAFEKFAYDPKQLYQLVRIDE